MFALCTSLLGAMFPLPRILYAMSSDGILFKLFQRIHTKTKTPLIATLISGLIAAIMAMIFNLQQLIDMMSIGTLLAYTIVAICVLTLRFRFDGTDNNENNQNRTKIYKTNYKRICRQFINFDLYSIPDNITSTMCDICIILYCICSCILCFLLDNIHEHISNLHLAFILITFILMLLFILIVTRQPRSNTQLNFKVPFVPLLPFLSIFVNLYLMFQLDIHTWIRFLVWIIIGYTIYFTYGIQNSKENKKNSKFNQTEQSKNNVNAHTMQSIDDLRNANMEFAAISSISLNDKY